VFLDQFSNRVFLYPCKKSINSKGAAKAYFETVYRAQGICKTIVSDNGSLFSSQFWEELFRLMGVDVKHSSVYYPQAQGRVEKFNSVIVEALRIFCLKNDAKLWDNYLIHLETIWNSTVRNSTNLTPFQIIYGRDVRTVVDLSPDDQEEDVDEVRDEILAAIDIARDALTLSAIQNEKFMKQHRKQRDYKVGEMVMLSTRDLKLPETVAKMKLRFVGPFKIHEKVSDSSVRLEFTSRFQHLKKTVFNVSKLRPYYVRDVDLENSVAPPLPLIQQDGDFYEVERILARRGKGNRVQYLVKWKGYDQSSDNSWLHSREFTTDVLKKMIRDFNLLVH